MQVVLSFHCIHVYISVFIGSLALLTIICTRLFILVFTILNTFDIPVFCWLTFRLQRDSEILER